MSTVPALKKLYAEQVVPELTKLRGYKNVHQVPRITKIVINTGIDSEADKNQIADITPLAKLVKLQYLQLEDNQIQKIDAVASLKALNALYLSRNQIEAIAPVAELPKLAALYLEKNKVSDASPLKAQRWLERLDLKDNQLKDVSALSGMTELRYLFLERNQIGDLAPLVEMAKKDAAGERRFAPYWNLYLAGNPVSDASKAQVAELAKIGVRVKTE